MQHRSPALRRLTPHWHSTTRLAAPAAAWVCAVGVLVPLSAHAQDAAAPAPQSLPPVVVISNQGSMRPGALRNDIVKTESIGARAIERAGATNINEALDKNPGIAVQVECSVCNVRNVLLNNLPGRYTTLLIDGIPIFSSVSSAYGLDSVSVWGVERIDVARGAGASLIAPEALAGTVNIVTKRPQEDEARLRAQIGSYGSRQLDGYGARTFEGGALTATYSLNNHNTVDANGDGVSEYTGYRRHQFGLGYFADDVGGFKLRSRLDFVNEKRGGGGVGGDYAAIKASTSGNPFDFSKGPNGSSAPNGWDAPDGSGFVPYDGGRGGFTEIIFTDRTQFVSSGERNVGDGKLRLAFGAAQHKQDSFYEFSLYDARQAQYYAEVSYQLPVGEWLFTSGLNYRYENLRSHGFSVANGINVNGIDNYTYRVPGLFVQAYTSLLDDKLELNGSLRYDRHNVFGGIVSPRLNLLFHHDNRLSSRLSLGTGFRAPTSFFEQDHGVLDDIAIVRDINKPEKSLNLGYALNYATDRLVATASYNFNRIKNVALLQPGQPDPNGGAGTVTLFTSDPNPVTVQGVDFNLSYQVSPALTVSAGAERFHYNFTPGTLSFARPESRAVFGANWNQGDWDLGAKLLWTGRQNLARFYDYANNPQYNFDGSTKRDWSPSFATLDLRGEYRVSSHLSIYAGADNVTDYKQIDKENFLWIDSAGAYDTTHIWGPSRGRYVYAGIKASF